MDRYIITREQLDELKEKAVLLRKEPTPDVSELAGISYEMEQLVAEVETSTESGETEMSDDDDEEEN